MDVKKVPETRQTSSSPGYFERQRQNETNQEMKIDLYLSCLNRAQCDLAFNKHGMVWRHVVGRLEPLDTTSR